MRRRMGMILATAFTLGLAGCGLGQPAGTAPIVVGPSSSSRSSVGAPTTPSAQSQSAPSVRASSLPSQTSTDPMDRVDVDPRAYVRTTGAVGFAVTFQVKAGTVQVGPGWALQGSTLVQLYGGGTLPLPSSISTGTHSQDPRWPILIAVADAGSWSTATSAVVVITVPADCGPGSTFAYPLTACPTGADGQGPPVNLTNATATLATVTETVQVYVNGQLQQQTFSAPTWVLWDNTLPQITWSGGSFGAGTPLYQP